MRTFGGREQIKASFQHIALSGLLNISAQKICVTLQDSYYEKNIDTGVMTVDRILKEFNDIFFWNEEQLLSFELEKEISTFIAYVNVKKSYKYSSISVQMSKFLAYKMGFLPYHELMSVSSNLVSLVIDAERTVICNLLSGLSQIHLISSDLCSHNNCIISTFSLTDQEISNHFIGVKPVIYKNITATIYFDKVSPKNVHFNLLTDIGEKLMLRYCKLSVKCQRVSRKQ